MDKLGIHLITIEVTALCNLRCLHCYCGESNVPETFGSFDRENMEIVITELQKIKPHFITLSGGEPLLIGDALFEIAGIVKKFCKKLFLTTNGQIVQRYPADSFFVFDHVQISLDGTKEIHEMIRGRGTFDKTINSARYLREAGISVSFLMTLNALNKDLLKETYLTARSLDVRFGAERMCSVGRGKNVQPISAHDWRNLLETIKNEKIGCGDPLYFAFEDGSDKKRNERKIIGGCTAGIATLAITPSLDILPCVRLRLPLGNLRNRNLEDIWTNSRILKNLRNRSMYRGKCGICVHRKACSGCRADAYARTGDYLESDPACWLEVGDQA